jgi:hypothetical protein
VLSALDASAPFDTIEGLRDGIAHGAIDLNHAIKTAETYMELIRNAVHFTVMRILGFNEGAAKSMLVRPNVSDRFTPRYVLIGSLEFEPPPYDNFDGQPDVQSVLLGVKTEKVGDKLNISPSLSFRILTPGAKLAVR